MYNLRYVRNDGKTITMTPDSDYIIATVSGVTGYETSLSTSQGYEQTGNSVDGTSVSGQSIAINGFVLGVKPKAKRELLNIFAPQTQGRLYWEESCWIDVYVKSSPSITQEVNSKFSLVLFAPYPYWRSVEQSVKALGITTKMFRFPVNYSESHCFGEVNTTGEVNCYNEGSAAATFTLYLKAPVKVVDPVIINTLSGKKLKFNGTLQAGDLLTLYRDVGAVRLELTRDNVTTNALDMLDDSSDLFQLDIGDNVLTGDAELNGASMQVTIIYYNSWAGVLIDGI